VELLTVVVIISMLAGMSMLALNSAMTSSKESKTRGTIAKLDAAILDIFESYQERYDSITFDGTFDNNLAAFLSIPVANLTDQQRALAKLHFIHDIMRMEMPFKWDEVIHNAGTPLTPADTITVIISGSPSTISATQGGLIPFNVGTGWHVLTNNPPVLQYYRRAYASITSTTNTAPQSSELLFLIIANLNPEALENFHGSEIGDIDGNGLREFHDAWGHPIQFIRFAPAFTGSDLQPDVITASNYPLSGTTDNTTSWENPLNFTTITPAIWNDPSSLSSPKRELIYAMSHTGYLDPFDPNNVINRTWFMYPLIVSGGADGIVDLNVGINLPASVTTMDDIYSPLRTALGMPNDYKVDGTLYDNGVLNHYDNIHNHRSGNSF
jgi:hypothetical protein